MNVYGDVVDDRMKEAHSKVAALVFTSTAPEKSSSAQVSKDHSSVGSAHRSA
jgi:ribosomal protein L18E